MALPFWRKVQAHAADHDVKIAIEMHPHNIVYNPATMQRLATEINATHVGAEMDPSHLFWQGIEPIEAVRHLGGLVYNAAAKDTRINAAARINGVLDDSFGRVAPDDPDALSLGGDYTLSRWPATVVVGLRRGRSRSRRGLVAWLPRGTRGGGPGHGGEHRARGPGARPDGGSALRGRDAAGGGRSPHGDVAPERHDGRVDAETGRADADQAAARIVELTGVPRHDARRRAGVRVGAGGRGVRRAGRGVPDGRRTRASWRPSRRGTPARSGRTTCNGVRVLAYLGRTHLYEGHGLAARGARRAHGRRLPAPGSRCSPTPTARCAATGRSGRPVLVADHLNLTGTSPLEGARFVDLTDAWSPRLRALARELDPSLAEGVYAWLRGPHYETWAEAAWLRTGRRGHARHVDGAGGDRGARVEDGGSSGSPPSPRSRAPRRASTRPRWSRSRSGRRPGAVPSWWSWSRKVHVR